VVVASLIVTVGSGGSGGGLQGEVVGLKVVLIEVAVVVVVEP